MEADPWGLKWMRSTASGPDRLDSLVPAVKRESPDRESNFSPQGFSASLLMAEEEFRRSESMKVSLENG